MIENNGDYTSPFFALVFRQKYIMRWGLMRNINNENLSQHACECAFLSHALAVIGNTFFGQNYNVDRTATLALYHDVSEVFTGDMPTPIKYANSDIKNEFENIETQSAQNLLQKLPGELKNAFSYLFIPDKSDESLLKLVKAADKLCAFIKCIEEEKFNNHEFSKARISTQKVLSEMCCPELDYFMKHFLPPFSLTLDEQQEMI